MCSQALIFKLNQLSDDLHDLHGALLVTNARYLLGGNSTGPYNTC